MRLMRMLLACALLLAAAGGVGAQQQPPRPANRGVFIDREGVIRWRDTRQEVALYGANYTLPSASDFRAAGYLKLDRKKLVEEDMAHFARMGWDALRLSFWGDWENSDRAGNLVENEHLDLQDYLIAQARARGIYILFSPITTYNANWPDELQDTTDPGFSKYYDRGKLGTDSAAWAAQVNYIRQLLDHVNPYTGMKLKDEPAMLFVEPINEPWHRSEDIPLSIRYINALSDAIRSTGSQQLIFYNVSQDFRIADAIRAAKVQGVTFGWYPTGLNSGRELQGNHLRSVDHFDPMLDARIKHLPRIVYEFDSPDLRTGYMYPAMARTMRAVGAQFAAMFAYDMLRTSARNLGWQTHYLNLVYTPRKAISSVIAAEAMRRLPRMRNYGPYPANTRFGDFRISYESNSSELLAADAFMHAGNTSNAPPDLKRLQRIAAYGSSPLIEYQGEGVYFVDRLKAGVWRLEVYPDAVPVRDPFEMPNADKIVTRAIYRAWPMRIQLPDLGANFTIQPLNAGNSASTGRAQDGRFTITPGVYLLSASGPVAASTLPAFVGHVGLKEFHAPAPDSMPVRVTLSGPDREYVSGEAAEISARVMATTSPDSVTLFIRPVGRGWFNRYAMEQHAGYDYRARIPADSLRAGPYQYVISVTQAGRSTTFPEGIERRPWDWDFSVRELWTLHVVSPATPLRLLSPGADAPMMSFTRIGDAGRTGIFRVTTSEVTGQPALHLELPVINDWSPDDYTASLVIKERIRARALANAQPKSLKLRVRGVGPRQLVHVTLVESDGTSWSVPVEVDATWSERIIPLADFVAARSVLLPQGFPGQWSYWVGAAQGRGGAGDVLRWREIERLQISLRPPEGVRVTAGSYGVEIESVSLLF